MTASTDSSGTSQDFDLAALPKQIVMTPLALRAPDAARALGLSERQLWALTNAGEVPSVRLGKRLVYPVDLLRMWLTEQGRKALRRRARTGKAT